MDVQKTLEKFQMWGGYSRPFKVLLDSSVFGQLGFTLKMIKSFLQDEKATFYTTQCVKTEVQTMRKFGLVPSIEFHDIALQRCRHGVLTAYDTNCLKKLVGDYNPHKFVIVTSNAELAQEVEDNLQVVVITCKSGQLYLNSSSDEVVSLDHQILQDDFKRLKMRLRLFSFVETDVGIGANSFFEAASLQRGLGGYKELKKAIICSFQRNQIFYKDGDRDYGLLMESLSQDGIWPDSRVLQAVADYLHVRISVLSGCKDQMLMEWTPSQVADTEKLEVVYVSFLEGLRYGSLSHIKYPSTLTDQEGTLDIEKLFQKNGPRLESDYYRLRGYYKFSSMNDFEQSLLLSRVNRRLETYNFKWERILGDGNCFFRSLAYSKYGSQEHFEVVKDEILDQLVEHHELYRDEVYQNYIEGISAPNAWGDNITLQAFADLHRCRVLSLAPTASEIAYDYFPSDYDLRSGDEDFFLVDCGYHNDVAVRK